MWNLIVSLAMPPLLVFGLYHLMTWFNIRDINSRVYWKRVAMAAAVSHFVLVTGFFVFSYLDYRTSRDLSAFGLSYADFLFNASEFWRLILIFDTAAMAAIIGLFAVMDRLGIALPGLIPVTIGVTYLVGSLQWYYGGGGVGALLERFWSGLKTGDDDDEWFQ